MTMLPILITPGEALDRLTILQLKRERCAEGWKAALTHDHDQLLSVISNHYQLDSLQPARQRLLEINTRLWDLEDRMHTSSLTDSDAGCIGRAIALENGRRSAEKKAVDEGHGARPEYKKYKAPS